MPQDRRPLGVQLAHALAARGVEVVFLCYKLGAPEVAYWHPLDDGYRGRKPLESEPEMLRG